MKKMKKIFAALLTLAMVLGMSMTTFAVNITGTPSENDKATITVQNVESGATVKAYQIVEATYNQNNIVGFSGYAPVSLRTTEGTDVSVNSANVLQPTAQEITTIANAIASNKLNISSVNVIPDGYGNYTADVGAGYWLIIVENTNTTIYNPMLAGVYYANEDGTGNTLEGGTVDADSKLTIGSTPVYAKSTDVPVLDKEIAESSYASPENKKGNDLKIGDTVSFKLTTTIPDYSDAYTNLTFKITDTLDAGLTFDADSFKLNGKDLPGDVTATVNGQTATINFTEEYIKENGNLEITVTYDAVLNDKATVNFVANKNTAYITYTNNQGETANGEEKKTYHYTFALDGMLNGENGVDTIKTSEIIKVDENGNVVNKVDTENKTSAIVTGALGGATFELYQKDGEGNIIQATRKTAVSSADGYMNFSGLDAGTYYLKETEAPNGYQIDNTEHEVVIAATYNENGTLKSYTITIDGERTSTYTATYTGETITNIDSTVETTTIKNTKLSELPSTGGIGTTIFTIGGCIIMIAAAGLFFASRRKENK